MGYEENDGVRYNNRQPPTTTTTTNETKRNKQQISFPHIFSKSLEAERV